MSSEQLVAAYLQRIERIDRAGPKLKSVIALSRHALADARKLDAGRRAGKVGGDTACLRLCFEQATMARREPEFLPNLAALSAIARAYDPP